MSEYGPLESMERWLPKASSLEDYPQNKLLILYTERKINICFFYGKWYTIIPVAEVGGDVSGWSSPEDLRSGSFSISSSSSSSSSSWSSCWSSLYFVILSSNSPCCSCSLGSPSSGCDVSFSSDCVVSLSPFSCLFSSSSPAVSSGSFFKMEKNIKVYAEQLVHSVITNGHFNEILDYWF